MILRLSASADVLSDIAIRRHQALVSCAFSFCWAAWSAHPPPSSATPPAPGAGGGERGSRARRAAPAATMLPRAIRAVRAWLAPGIALQRWWQAWSKAPPPRQLQALMTSLEAGHGLHLYIPG
jgi:uncharacterized protein YjiS (DUF1127 family)